MNETNETILFQFSNPSISKVVYDEIPGDRPDNTRTVYYCVANMTNNKQLINVQKQKFVNFKWQTLSEESQVLPNDWNLPDDLKNNL